MKNPSTAASAASRSGWTDPWPPPCPDEVMSGRGGSGAGGSRCGTAPAGALCCARARGGRGLRASRVTSVTREVTTTSVVLWALLASVVRDTTPTTGGGRLGRPETLAAPCFRAGPAPSGAAGELSGLAGVVAIGADAAMDDRLGHGREPLFPRSRRPAARGYSPSSHPRGSESRSALDGPAAAEPPRRPPREQRRSPPTRRCHLVLLLEPYPAPRGRRTRSLLRGRTRAQARARR